MKSTSRNVFSVAVRRSWGSIAALLAVSLCAAGIGCVGDTGGENESDDTASAVSASDKSLAFNSYNNAFYVSKNGVGYYVRDTNRGVPGRGDFWRVCEQIEAAEDAYERTGSGIYRTMVGELLNGLNELVSGTTDFASWNKFNDDVMWAVIALARGYEITGNRTLLDQAQWQFNAIWSRGWDNTLGGGLWWSTDRASKNACVNGPATIAAMILARNTVSTGYRAQADRIYQWLRTTLVNTSTGQVADHIEASGAKVGWAFTYNQGTFAGAASLLYQSTGNTSYRTDAARAVSWARSNLTGQHSAQILNDEYGNDRNSDSAGFKGIFVRWAAKYANVANDTDIKSWLRTNANAAWANRSSSGVMWGRWWHRTPDDYVTSWESSSGVVITQVAP
jgi:predicted alpha-1,6-mannanase (GH76 family)